jgi:hypothetical protein
MLPDTDIHQTLEYRIDRTLAKGVPYALVLILLGLFGLAIEDDTPADIAAASFIVIGAGGGWTAWAIVRRLWPGKPLFVLSPQGVHYRIGWVKHVLVPWREIEGIDTIDITVRVWLRYTREVTFHDVTVILVPKAFYDAHIHLDSLFMRGPYWGGTFVPKGDQVQMALHHESVSVDRETLRAAVEARWRAFRGAAASDAARDGKAPRRRLVPAVRSMLGRRESAPPPPPGIPAPQERRRTWPAWEAAKIAVPLAGIAVVLGNLLGVWATKGQIAAREARERWAQEEQRWDEEQRELDEKLRQIRKNLDDTLRNFDRRR